MIASLAGGGAERVMSLLASHWVTKYTAVTLLTFYPESHDHFQVDPRVERRVVGTIGPVRSRAKAVLNTFRRMRALRRTILSTRPDVVVSFMDRTNVLTLFATWGTRIPVVVAERVDPMHQFLGRMNEVLRRVSYRRAEVVVVQSRAVERWAHRFLSPVRVRRIPNPVIVQPYFDFEGSAPAASDVDVLALDRAVVAMGRLSPQKGFDVLLQAFAEVSARWPHWRLVILGEGEERDALLALAERLGIAEKVHLVGWTDDPASFLRRAGLFVLSSRYEGFPNALLEAMAHGAAVIAADCPSGPREIVRDGVDGVLVRPEDVESLAAAMDELISKPAERERLGRSASGVTERFSLDRVVSLWDAVLVGSTKK